MDRDELLKKRGWVQHGAGLDLWQPPGATGSGWWDGDDALNDQREDDLTSAEAHGSVTYRPTAEQAQTSPLLAACAARGMCERDVIEHLHRETQHLGRGVRTLAEMQPAVHLPADEATKLLVDALERSEAIREAWKALAKAERQRHHAAILGNEEASASAFQRVYLAREALRALGVDPDAADEPGQVST